jgi:hypothetical protein
MVRRRHSQAMGLLLRTLTPGAMMLMTPWNDEA